jgi:hypothetical protein
MPDTGAAAGQQVEAELRLSQDGAPLSYADFAAFDAAGWALVYRAAQTTQSFTYTIQPHPDAELAAEGVHLVVWTLVNGQGPLSVQKPTTGTGWANVPAGWQVGAEQVDIDGVYGALLSSVGIAVAESNVVTADFSVIEGDSFSRQFTARETALTLFDYTCENLDDGTLALTCEIRAAANRQGAPTAYAALTVVTATTGSDPVLRISWSTFPTGLRFPDSDADVTPVDFEWDGQAYGTKAWNVTAIATGLAGAGTFTVAGDRRKWFAKGGTFGKTGTAAATYTVLSVAYTGGNTIVTAVEAVADGTVDGTLSVPITITLGDGKITVYRQETLTP